MLVINAKLFYCFNLSDYSMIRMNASGKEICSNEIKHVYINQLNTINT